MIRFGTSTAIHWKKYINEWYKNAQCRVAVQYLSTGRLTSSADTHESWFHASSSLRTCHGDRCWKGWISKTLHPVSNPRAPSCLSLLLVPLQHNSCVACKDAIFLFIKPPGHLSPKLKHEFIFYGTKQLVCTVSTLNLHVNWTRQGPTEMENQRL